MNNRLDFGCTNSSSGNVALHTTSFKSRLKEKSCNPQEYMLTLFFSPLFSLGHPILHTAKDHHFSVERRRCYSFLTCCSHAYHGPLETSLFLSNLPVFLTNLICQLCSNQTPRTGIPGN